MTVVNDNQAANRDKEDRGIFWFVMTLGLFLGMLIGMAVAATLNALHYRETHGANNQIANLQAYASQVVRGGDLGRMPNLHGFINQQGKPVNAQMFKGKVQIVTFLNPYGEHTSPVLVASLMNLYEELKRGHLLGRKVVFVSYNLQPGVATPSVMRHFLTTVTGDPPFDPRNWSFLTASPRRLSEVVGEDFRVNYHILNDADYRHWAQHQRSLGLYHYARAVNPLHHQGPKNQHVVDHDVVLLIGPQGKVRVKIKQATAYSPTKMMSYVAGLLSLPGMSEASDGH